MGSNGGISVHADGSAEAVYVSGANRRMADDIARARHVSLINRPELQ